jgi:hypothetical protein
MAQGSNLTFLKIVFFVNSVNSILIDTFAVFRERKMWKMLLQQFTITEECWKEWKNHFDGAQWGEWPVSLDKTRKVNISL